MFDAPFPCLVCSAAIAQHLRKGATGTAKSYTPAWLISGKSSPLLAAFAKMVMGGRCAIKKVAADSLPHLYSLAIATAEMEAMFSTIFTRVLFGSKCGIAHSDSESSCTARVYDCLSSLQFRLASLTVFFVSRWCRSRKTRSLVRLR